MLLDVRKLRANFSRRAFVSPLPRPASRILLAIILFATAAPAFWQFASSAHNATAASSLASAATPRSAPASPQSTNNFPTNIQSNILNTVVLDPAHGGTDPGARGTGGIRESDVVLEFAAQVRHALESQGLQVVQTRLGDENPSFDDRSTMANAQRAAVFVTLHISSTGPPGTARVYVNSDLPAITTTTGLLPWDQAQSPFLGLSRKLGDIVQSFLAQRFKGSPNAAQAAAVRQLRTTAAPAIAVEVSSVSVEKREDLDRMAPGVADAIARGVAAFKPSYIVPTLTTTTQFLPAPSAAMQAPATSAPTAPRIATPTSAAAAATRHVTSPAAPNGVPR
jgi:N-acetylmuramoyl-L-alanine amidase